MWFDVKNTIVAGTDLASQNAAQGQGDFDLRQDNVLTTLDGKSTKSKHMFACTSSSNKRAKSQEGEPGPWHCIH